MEVEFKEITQRPVIGIRRRIPKSEIGKFIPEVFGKVGAFLNSRGMEMIGPPVAIYYEVTENEMDVAAAGPVAEITATADDIIELELSGGKIASAIYTGPYEGIPAAWDEFMSEIVRQGKEPVEPCWEEYLTDPSSEPDSSKWQTLMVQPLRS